MGVGSIKKTRSLKRLSESTILVCKWDLLYMLLCMIGFINFLSWCHIAFFLLNHLDKRPRKRKRKPRNPIKRSKRRKKKPSKLHVGARWRKLWRRRKGGTNETVVNHFTYSTTKWWEFFQKVFFSFYIKNFCIDCLFYITAGGVHLYLNLHLSNDENSEEEVESDSEDDISLSQLTPKSTPRGKRYNIIWSQ